MSEPKRVKHGGAAYHDYVGDSPRIAMVLTPLDETNLALAAQIGVTDVVFYNMDEMPDTVDALLTVKHRVEAHGLRLAAVEGGPPMDLIVQGMDGRDEQIEHYKTCIRAMGEAGISILCYNFMPWSFRVGRTSYSCCGRGGSLTSEWRWDQFDDSTRNGEETDAETMWANLEYFIRAVVPVAEEAGVYLAIHPDDPPVPTIRGQARIFHSPADFERLLSIVDSPHNGLTFCQGCYSEMGVDIPDTVRRLGHRAHFVHFRDVLGTATGGFIETFQDEGQTDMHAALQAWREVGFRGIIRPDHVPLLPGIEEGHDTCEKARGYFSGKASGYTMMGRIFAAGFLRGLMQAVFGKDKGSAKYASLRGDLQTPP